MKLEKNMYVRTKWGIARLTGECWEDFGGDLAYAVDCCLQPIDETKIFKEDIIGEPSFNPIDVIKVGDYVNGYQVKDIDYAFDDIVMNNKNPRYVPYIDCNKNNYIDDIKSIVTKEQFEAMAYRIGE